MITLRVVSAQGILTYTMLFRKNTPGRMLWAGQDNAGIISKTMRIGAYLAFFSYFAKNSKKIYRINAIAEGGTRCVEGIRYP
jgi:hypothetical protein